MVRGTISDSCPPETVKLTPLKLANVPPPMALFDLELPSNAIDFAMIGSNKGLAVLHQQGIELYELDLSTKPAKAPKLVCKMPCPPHGRQISFRGDEELVVLVENVIYLWDGKSNELVPLSEPMSNSWGYCTLLSDINFRNAAVADWEGRLYAIDGTQIKYVRQW